MDSYDSTENDADMRQWAFDGISMFDNAQWDSPFNQQLGSFGRSPSLQASPLFDSPKLGAGPRSDSMQMPLEQKSLPRNSLEDSSSASPESSTHDSFSESSLSRKRKPSPNRPVEKAEFLENQLAEGGSISPPTHSDRDMENIGSTLNSSLAFNNSTPSSPLSNWMTNNSLHQNISPSAPENSLSRIAHISMPSSNNRTSGFQIGDVSRDGSPSPAVYTGQPDYTNDMDFTQTSAQDTGLFNNLNGNWTAAPAYGTFEETISPEVQQFTSLSPPQPLNTPPEQNNSWYPMEQTKPNRPSPPSDRPNLWLSVEHPKTRVETQLQLKLVLNPMPTGVTALHFPRNAITKPKNQASDKELQIYSGKRGTLELSTSLVCNTPMQNPELYEKAMRRARGELPITERRHSTASVSGGATGTDDPNHPINGGEVHICSNCMNRERKRSMRRRVKKPEDEKAEYDVDKVIIFNDREYKEWDEAIVEKQDVPYNPNWSAGAKQVRTAMRITCYGRHQQEKNGFRVIFTLKDWEGNVVAQTMSMPIHITDDHKTPVNTQGESQFPAPYTVHHPSQQPFRPYNSALSLTELSNRAAQQQIAYQNALFNQQSMDQPVTMHNYSASASVTPRSLSRSASPSSQFGPNKKRKASFSGARKIPASLQMSRIDQAGAPKASTGVSTAYPLNNGMTALSPTNSMMPTPLSTSGLSGMGGQPSLMSPTLQSGYNSASTGAFFSAPTSAHHSRAPSGATSMIHSAVPSRVPSPMQSPDMLRHSQDQFASMGNNMFSNLNQQNEPWISKIVAQEGPQTGGNEVTCLGHDFTAGMTVMFGEVPSPSTVFWGPNTLVCRVPPSNLAGPVPVYLCTSSSNPHQSVPVPLPVQNHDITFTYYPGENFDPVNLAIRRLNRDQAVLAAQQAAAAAGLPPNTFMPDGLQNM